VEEELLSPARERMREARRMALLEAAEQVFAERGFAGPTVAEIATALNAKVLYGKEQLNRHVHGFKNGIDSDHPGLIPKDIGISGLDQGGMQTAHR